MLCPWALNKRFWINCRISLSANSIFEEDLSVLRGRADGSLLTVVVYQLHFWKDKSKFNFQNSVITVFSW